MKPRPAAHRPVTSLGVVAIVVAGLAVSIQLVGTAQMLAAGTSFAEYVRGFHLAELTMGVSTIVVGGFLAVRRPRNVIGWLLLALGCPGSLDIGGLGWLSSLLAGPARVVDGLHFMGLIALVLLLFPHGRPVSRVWRLPVIAVAGCLFVLVGTSVATGDMDQVWNRVEGAVFAPAMLLGAASLVVRMRRADHETRLRIRWFVFTGTVAVIVFIGGAVVLQVPHITNAIALPLVPIGVATAVLRDRLYDIDRVVSRSVAYGVTTVVLAGIYASAVLVIGGAVRVVAASGAGDLVVAASTLAVAAAFGPVRRRVQSVVDRRFDRARYDAARTLEAFGARLRDQLDPETLGEEVRSITARTFQPVHVSMWTGLLAEGGR